jgi:LAO/AO transport system kinase
VAGARWTDAETGLDQARRGDRGALARLLTLVEQGGDGAAVVDRLVFGIGVTAPTVGLTGSPGAGKSTLVNALVHRARSDGRRVAVLAIDPSSPFTGGAILGDRVRMGDHALDDGVFIRSMATRGHLGGLAVATPQSARLLAAVGYDLVLIETVGVGQVEVEVAGEADLTVVVVNPGWGDAVQANKAGLMEIADVFVINKADRPGTEATRRDLDQMLSLSAGSARPGGRGRPGEGRPPILATVATDADGIDELWSALEATLAWLDGSGEAERRHRDRTVAELQRVMAARVAERVADLSSGPAYDRARDQVLAGQLAPWDAADRLLGPPA